MRSDIDRMRGDRVEDVCKPDLRMILRLDDSARAHGSRINRLACDEAAIVTGGCKLDNAVAGNGRAMPDLAEMT